MRVNPFPNKLYKSFKKQCEKRRTFYHFHKNHRKTLSAWNNSKFVVWLINTYQKELERGMTTLLCKMYSTVSQNNLFRLKEN